METAEFVWTPECSIGKANLDWHHKRLLSLCCRLNHCLGADSSKNITEFAEILPELYSYADMHFKVEEHGLTVCDCPMLLVHQQQHDAYREALKEQERNTTRGFIDKSVMEKYLWSWWFHHIKVMDKQCEKYFL